MREFGPPNEASIVRYTKNILCGLQYLHALGFVHGDIKCEMPFTCRIVWFGWYHALCVLGDNLLLTMTGEVKLADFGCCMSCAEVLEGAERGPVPLKGTVPFMAPEGTKLTGV